MTTMGDVRFQGLDALGRLAVAQAFYQSMGAAVKTGDPSSLRGRVDAEALAEYAERGTRSRDVLVGGVKVGTYSVSEGKPRVRVVDGEAFRGWAVESGLMVHRVHVDWSLLTDEQADAVARLAESIAPGCAHVWDEPDTEWTRYVKVVDGACVDADGQVVPGVEVTREPSTRLALHRPGGGKPTVADALASMAEPPTLAEVLGGGFSAALPEGGEADG